MNETALQEQANTRYRWLLVILLSCQSSILAFDRGTFILLSPYVKPDLGLTNAEVGMISGALSLSAAISGLFIGGLSDRLGRRKMLLVATTVIFSCASILSGLARNFASMAGARLLLGLAGGGSPPIAQAMVVAEVAPQRRGVSQATISVAGNLFGGFLAPVVTVGLAVAYGWRTAFFVAGLPGLLIALAIFLFLREVKVEPRPAGTAWQDISDLLRNRTLMTCVVLAFLLVGSTSVGSFLPLYLIDIGGITPTEMSWIMAGVAPVGLICGIGMPWLSDRVGRKPMLISAQVIALPGYYFMITGVGSAPLLLAGAMLGAAIAGMMPLAMAIIPAEAVKAHQTATALGLTVAVSQLFAGAGIPVLAGRLADIHGLEIIPWLMLGFAALACLISLTVPETAPARRKAV